MRKSACLECDLANLHTSHMYVQQPKAIPVAGYSSPANHSSNAIVIAESTQNTESGDYIRMRSPFVAFHSFCVVSARID